MTKHHNSYEACSKHINGHLPYCCQCQEEGLRDVLRKVANCDAHECADPAGDDIAHWFELSVPVELWAMIAPLRNVDIPPKFSEVVREP